MGHRVVHGGETFASSVLINDEVHEGRGRLHASGSPAQPRQYHRHRGLPARCWATTCRRWLCSTPLSTRPCRSTPICTAIPYKYYENDKLRRYGFHGTSHRYVTLRAAELLGKDPKDLKIVSCHLGNGSSLAAVDGGKCVDTSMGLTPLAGLPMGTRAGDMDVGVIEYVANKYDRSISSVMEGLNKRSGMMGLSGVSSDFRDLEAAAAKGHHRSAIALRIFEYRVHKMIAEYAAAMNGLDVVIFTAGVGENAPSTRAHILEGLEFMGITCDEEKNNTRGEERIISKDGAPVTVMVIPTNEELMIAQDTLSIVEENKNK